MCSSDLWYGGVPDEIRVDRIFRYEGVVRAEMQIEGDNWVEVGYFRDDDFRPGTETGWVAQHINAPAPEDSVDRGPGETLWTRD